MSNARNALRAVSDTPPRATIYLRQSTHRDESISLELQEIACRDYCDRMGYTVVAVEQDPGVSGRTWKRPAVQRAMQAVEDHETDIIVLWKWSRLSRSRTDWALAIDRADLAGGRIESATEPIDTATASGRFARGVMTEYAAFQSEQIGETWEEVRQRRLNLGLPVSGRLPYGWRWVKGEGIEQHPDQAPVVVEMYRRYLAGDGASAIAQWLNEQKIPGQNGLPWVRLRPLTVMDSPIHAGLVPYRGETYPGAHEPIIDEATRKAYLAERRSRRETKSKPKRYDHILSLLVRCECGARMHGKGSITGGHYYSGYLCSDTLNGHELRAYVSSRTIEPVIVDWLMTFDPEVDTRRDNGVDRARRDRVNRELVALEEELAALTRQHVKGIVPESAYVRARDGITVEIDRLNDELRSIPVEVIPPTRAEIETLRGPWPGMTTAAKNLALRQMIREIRIQDSCAQACITTTWGHSSVVTL